MDKPHPVTSGYVGQNEREPKTVWTYGHLFYFVMRALLHNFFY